MAGISQLLGQLTGPAAGQPVAPGELGGGLPPELAGLLAQLGSPGGPPPGGGGQQPVEDVDQAIKILTALLQKEPDEEDKAVIAKCVSALQGILAKDQKERDGAMGGQMSQRFMRKTAGAY